MYILTGANLGEAKDYPDMNPNLAMFTQVFVNSIGEISMPDYSRWCQDKVNKKKCNPVFVGTIWGVFMFHNILVVIILLNFLISIIGQSYEKVWTYKEIYIFMNKMELNCEYYSFMNFWG